MADHAKTRRCILLPMLLPISLLMAFPGMEARPTDDPPPPKFRARVIDPVIGNVCYAVTIADVNGDGKQDIVGVSENAVYLYENPSWRKCTIIADQTERDNVCIAAHDLDGDGKIDFALGAGWTRVGTMQWLTRGSSLEEKWTVHPLGREAWTHRMRWGDVLGTGTAQLLVSPLNKTVGAGVRLLALEVPKNPVADAWPMRVIDATLDRMHNHWIDDLDGDGRDDLITASQEGVSLFRLAGSTWTRTLVGPGAPGSGEVKVGSTGSGQKFLACIEPMHGTQVAFYAPEASGVRGSFPWKRSVLESNLKEGHAVLTADLNGDGKDEVIVGDRGQGGGVFAFVSGPGNESWQKHIIDNQAMLPEDLAAADLTGDGRMDIVAGGRATHNVILYENLGK